MPVKSIEMVRKIRDMHYDETKDLSPEKQIEFVKRKADQLQKKLNGRKRASSSKSH